MPLILNLPRQPARIGAVADSLRAVAPITLAELRVLDPMTAAALTEALGPWASDDLRIEVCDD